MILTIFLLIAVRACFAQAPPAFPDNILTPAGDVGLPPAISTEGDSETVNLTNGSLNMFIPALTLRQRSGTRPLVLGFTYNSNQWIIRQDVSVTLFSSELSSSDEGCSGFYCALATNYVPYDYDSYTELVEPSTPYNWLGGPMAVNLPTLRASMEYVGDAYATATDCAGSPNNCGTLGSGLFITPQICMTNFAFTDWSGTPHPFLTVYSQPASLIAGCAEFGAGYQNDGSSLVMSGTISSDNSLYYLDVSNLSDIKVTDKDGTVYHFTAGVFGSSPTASEVGVGWAPPTTNSSSGPFFDVASSIVDRNGSQISIQSVNLGGSANASFNITDTIGRKISVSPYAAPPSSQNSAGIPAQITYSDSNGQQQSVSLAVTQWTNSSQPDIGPVFFASQNDCWINGGSVGNGQSPPPSTQYQVGINSFDASPTGGTTTYVLQYGGTQKQYSFQFDSYGKLLKVLYPAGGYSRYDYQYFPYVTSQGLVQCNYGMTTVSHRYQCRSSSGSCGTEDTTIYDYTNPPQGTGCANATTGNQWPVVNFVSVIDPLGTKTVHCFTTLANLAYGTWIPVEAETDTFDSSNNLIKQIESQFMAGPGSGNSNFQFPTQVSTTIGNGASSRTSTVNYQYDMVGHTYSMPYFFGGKSATFQEDVPNPTQIDEYDFNSTHLKATTNSYWYSSANNVITELQSSTVTDPVYGNTTTKSFGLDSLGNVQTETLTGTKATTQSWDFRPLDSFGRPTQAKDGLGNVTTYSYTDANWSNSTCAPPTNSQAYLTSVTHIISPNNQTTTYSYDSCTGAIGSVTDPNTQTTSYGYDALERLMSVTYPDGGYVGASYVDTAPSSRTTTTSQAPGLNQVRETIYDGFFRTSQTQLLSDTSGTDYVDTTYDPVGRVASVSNAYRSMSDSTYGATQYFYDALDRKTEQIQSDGTSKLWWCYDGTTDVLHPQPQAYCRSNVSSFSSGMWVDSADENGNDSQDVFDALGHLRSVVEPSSTESDYAEDAFGNLLSVNQRGISTETPRTRSFSYTGLSQLIQSTNPETGTICYGQWSSGSCQGDYDADGNLLYKTDARGVTTSYNYDPLNRLTSKSFSNDPSATPWTCYQYDSSGLATTSANLIGRLANEWTQSSASGTCAASLPSSGVLTRKSVLRYDAMGRVKLSQQCVLTNCTSGTPFKLAHDYDLAGNMTRYTNGLEQMMLTQGFDTAGRLSTVTSSWDDPLHPPDLFSVQVYTPANALQNWTSGNGLNLNRTYDPRLRVTSETATVP